MVEADLQDDLPPGWVWVKISDIAETTSGGTPSRKIVEYYEGSIPWIKSGELKDTIITDSEERITLKAVRNSNAKIFPAGTALVALYGATVGRTGILGIDAATNQAVCAIFPLENSFTSKYMAYWLFSQRQNLINLSAGGAQPNINQGIIRGYPFPLAPLAEQQRIVEAIEAQFTRLDAGVAALKRLRTNLKRYKAAVLKAACEGRLVEQDPDDEPASELLERILKERRAKWAAEQRAKGKDPRKLAYKEPAAPDTADLPDLPEGWAWATVEEVGEVRLGRQRAPQHHTGHYMRPYLRVANVFEDYIDTSDILEMNFNPDEFERYRLQYGDILLNEGQSLELVGRSAIFRDEVRDVCFQNTLVRFRASTIILIEYAQLVFRTYLHSGRFQKIAKWTTNIAHLGAQRFANIEFPLPPIAEQNRIVLEVEALMSLIQQLEIAVNLNVKRAERLRQSILREAFAGRLVPQDPNDEPAGELLKRIRRNRTRQTNGKKRR